MKQLVSVKLVQFFLFEQIEVASAMITGLFGPNGSGKSSAIDAIQIAMFGGNQNLTALNAQADDKSGKRTIREYCLGQWGGAEERARDVANTYITLTFRDTDTLVPITVGVCIHANVDKDGHEVLGRYVVPGIELSLGDHLEDIDGKPSPRDWKSFRESLIRRSGQEPDEILFPDQSENFIRAHLLALRGKNGVPNVRNFLRAFRFALRLNIENSVDGLVRHEILEAKATETKKFKENVRSFKEQVDLIATVKRKIEGGQAIIDQLGKAELEASRHATWNATQKAGLHELAFDRLETANAEKMAAEEQQIAASSLYQTTQRTLSETREQTEHLRRQRDAHSAHQTLGALRASIEEARSRAASFERDVNGFFHQADAILARCKPVDDFKAHQNAIATCRTLLPNSLQSALAASVPELAHACDTVRKLSANIGGEAMRIAIGVNHTLTRKQSELATLKDELEQVNSGGPGLSGDVKRLYTALRERGMHPAPVGQLVRVTDKAWQPVIEAMLGSNRDALLIPPGEEKGSFECYQSLQGLYGVKMGMASRQHVGPPPKTGSIAELIIGDDQAAVAYVRAKFAEFVRANTSTEALACQRALTIDGMRVSGGDVDRLRPISALEFRLGRSKAERRAELASAVATLQREVDALTRQYDILDALVKDLSWLGQAGTWEQLSGAISQAQRASQDKALHEERMANTSDAQYLQLNADFDAAISQITQLEALLQSQHTDFINTNGKAIESAQESKAAHIAHEAAKVALDAARSAFGYDVEQFTLYWDQCLEQYGDNYTGMHDYAHEQAKQAYKRFENAKSRGMSLLGVFLTDHREQAGIEVQENWQQACSWALDLVTRLRDIELIEHEERAEEAYRVAQDAFTTDIAVRLNEQIEEMEKKKDSLNAALLACPAFSNSERYEFVVTPVPALSPLLKFVRDAADGILFNANAPMPEQFRELLGEIVTDGKRGAANPLEDYREFFTFDIAIYREDPLTLSRRRIGYLSARLGKGSGGEHRAPLYVIAGAALSSAYKLDAKSRDGIGLIMLDEAFHRMDPTNIIATMRYYEDLGLQVLLAGPGEHLATLTAFLHRYYMLVKGVSSNVIELDPHEVPAETRTLYRSDLPEFNPELIEQEMRRIETSAKAA
ncbi:SbcC/MukB-like Walker B domain-containing protein [Massilia antarctica]|uniref:SbcC/MukB-like Walker B domain-containing protein n=1 Tax=Massilia antarctica TaxID=2765360 RepID=UPI00226FF508|nr:SbcC/MukB-like Walker B domain-containing protein [Massilia sp. H27-R4]MCY0915211.1 AAA family ATPase [Massilia sp. H27-R4]